MLQRADPVAPSNINPPMPLPLLIVLIRSSVFRYVAFEQLRQDDGGFLQDRPELAGRQVVKMLLGVEDVEEQIDASLMQHRHSILP